MKKKLYKDKSNAVISGVLSGLSEYLNMDVTLVRIIYLALTLFTTVFPGVILYIIMAFIMPDKSEVGFEDYKVE
jgi:phage shock protein C